MRPDVQSCENLAGKHSNKCEVYNFLSSKSGWLGTPLALYASDPTRVSARQVYSIY